MKQQKSHCSITCSPWPPRHEDGGLHPEKAPLGAVMQCVPYVRFGSMGHVNGVPVVGVFVQVPKAVVKNDEARTSTTPREPILIDGQLMLRPTQEPVAHYLGKQGRNTHNHVPLQVAVAHGKRRATTNKASPSSQSATIINTTQPNHDLAGSAARAHLPGRGAKEAQPRLRQHKPHESIHTSSSTDHHPHHHPIHHRQPTAIASSQHAQRAVAHLGWALV